MTQPSARHRSWPSVLVEGVVIVVSILLAFGIQAWWDDAQEDQRAAIYAAGLLEDANANVRRLAVSRNDAERYLAATVELAEMLSRPMRAAESDSVLKLLAAAFAVPHFQPVTQAYDQVVAAGELGLLSPEIRTAVSEWTALVMRSKGNEVQSEGARNQVYLPFMVEETSLRRALALEMPERPFGESRFPAAVDELAGNRRLDNLLAYRIVFAQSTTSTYEAMNRALLHLITLVDGSAASLRPPP